MEDIRKITESINGEIDKFHILKLIFSESHFRFTDELFEFKKKLTDKMDYQLAIFNTLFELIKNNVLENVAGLSCVKIIFE